MLRSRYSIRHWGWLLRCLLIVIGSSVVWIVAADDKGPEDKGPEDKGPEDKGPHIPKGKGEQCVAETDFMRRDHMRLLVHQRDETVLKGIRDEPFSLSECVDCHAQVAESGEPVRIDAEGQFCQSCHAYAAVKIDCFGCHAAVPDQAASDHGSSSSSSSLTRLATYLYGKHLINAAKD